MKVLVINGPNLNMLGTREKEIYGNNDYKSLVALIRKSAKERGISVKCIQSNYEGDIVTAIQKASQKFDGIIINAGAYTHTSIAILDALKAVQIPTVEVHISKLKEREDFRQLSYISLYAFKTIIGRGFNGYIDALDELLHLGG
ncbi:MAG: type II 3-dehydroquinate dehydratase [Clostridia bacterium]|nr:type II 3-dehydroquinate dehydratase [Clostridia bacterium]